MKRIVYLHGLESKQGGTKVDFLRTLGEVFAPSMPYKERPKTLFPEILDEVWQFKPDIIIGSSMGGYFADVISTHTGTDVLLFNPGTYKKQKYFEDFGIMTEAGRQRVKGTVIIGNKDEVVNPYENYEYYQNENVKINTIENMGHRTPYNEFVKQVRNFITELEK
jgi:hypothetical protein